MCDNTEKIGHMQAIVLNNIPWGDRRKRDAVPSIASAQTTRRIKIQAYRVTQPRRLSHGIEFPFPYESFHELYQNKGRHLAGTKALCPYRLGYANRIGYEYWNGRLSIHELPRSAS